MAKLDLALVVRTVDQATRPLRRIQKTIRDVGRQTGLDRVGRRLGQVGRQVRRVGVEAAAFGRRFGLLTAGVAAGLGLFVGRYAAAGDKIAKMADRIGVGVEELQRLQFAFDIGGVSAEQSGRALEYFARSIGEAHKGTGEAAEIFTAMGIGLKNADGSLKTTRDLLSEVADAMAAQEDPAKKAFAAQRLFGRSGMPLVNALSGGAEGLRELGTEADRYRQISEKEARRSEDFIDSMTRLKEAVSGVGNALGADLLPALTPAIESMKEWLVENRSEVVDRLKTAVSDLAGMFSWIAGRIRDAVATLKDWHEWLGENVPFYDETIGKLADLAAELGLVKGAAILLGVWLGKGLLMAIIGLFRPLALLGWAVLTAAGKMLWLAATAVFAVGKALWGLVVSTIPAAIAALGRVGWAALAASGRFLWFAGAAVLAVGKALWGLVVSTIPAAIAAFARVGWAALAASGRFLWFAASAAIAAAGALWGLVRGAIPAAVAAFAWLGRVLWANPLILIGAAIALAALLIYLYWGDIAAWFERQWTAIKAAVPIGEWIEDIRVWGLEFYATLGNWWNGLVSWFKARWAAVKAAVPVGEWIEDLRAWGVNVLVTVKGWWLGLKEWFGARWAAVKAAVDVSAWIKDLEGWAVFGLFATLTGWWSGIEAEFRRLWAAAKAAVPVGRWLDELRAFDLVEVGKGWIQGLWDGMKSVWAGLTAWLDQKWADLLGSLNTVIEGLNYIPGVDIAPIPIPGQAAAVAAIPSDFRFGARGGSIFEEQRQAAANEDSRPTGGRFGNQGDRERTTTRVEVDFRNMPRGARHRVQSDRDADVEITTGYAMQGAQ